jgi:hypothetical protein
LTPEDALNRNHAISRKWRAALCRRRGENPWSQRLGRSLALQLPNGDAASVNLKKGKVHLALAPAKQPSTAQLDAIFVTDDPDYKPTLQKNGKWDAFYLGED